MDRVATRHGRRTPAADLANAYYRVPWALAQAGCVREAATVLSWMEREALEDGDLSPGPAQTPWTSENASYPLAIMAIGAWHLERYDTANTIMETLRRTSIQSPVAPSSSDQNSALQVGRRCSVPPNSGWPPC